MMSSFHAYLLFIALLQSAMSQIGPAITYISPNQVREIDGSVELQCSVSNAEEIPLMWTKSGEDTLYISVGNALLIPDNRYSIKQNVTSRTFTLKIDRLQLTDAGLYRCALTIAEGNPASAEVELQIRQPTT